MSLTQKQIEEINQAKEISIGISKSEKEKGISTAHITLVGETFITPVIISGTMTAAQLLARIPISINKASDAMQAQGKEPMAVLVNVDAYTAWADEADKHVLPSERKDHIDSIITIVATRYDTKVYSNPYIQKGNSIEWLTSFQVTDPENISIGLDINALFPLHLKAEPNAKPLYHHTCGACTFLGATTVKEIRYDLYYCTQGTMNLPTLIARYSDNGQDYTSGMHQPHPALDVARSLAKKRGLI